MKRGSIIIRRLHLLPVLVYYHRMRFDDVFDLESARGNKCDHDCEYFLVKPAHAYYHNSTVSHTKARV